MLCFNMSTAEQPQVSLTGTIQKLNIQVICFKPTIQLKSFEFNNLRNTKMFIHVTIINTECFLSFSQRKKLNNSFPQFTTVCNTLCVWTNTCPRIKKKKKGTSTSLIAISNQNWLGFHSVHVSFGLHIFSIGMSCNRTKLRAVDLREDNIKIHYITSLSQ